MLGMSYRFIQSRAGNFGITAALLMVPLVGSIGIAVDFSRSLNARSHIQDKADHAALSVARKGPLVNDQTLHAAIAADLTNNSNLENVQVQGRWTAANEFTVTVTGELPMTFATLIPTVGTTTPVSVTATARYREAQTIYKPPKTAQLDPEAGDYNRVYAYCYNEAEKDDPKTRGRSQEVAIADNGGTVYSFTFPSCGQGETLSYRLYNVRNSRTNKSNWDKASAEQYNYYTDTKQTFGKADTYSAGAAPMLETVLCPSFEKCETTNKGGVIPYGKNRTPVKATQPCAPGKFMYYGWEDRPPSSGDRDYDDIRVIVECPVTTFIGEETVRLVR